MSSDTQHPTPAGPQGPVGVFDSGLGGLSVLRHIRACLPQEDLIYFADAAYVPYGQRTEAEIAARSLAVASFFVEQRAKALVVACNTATAAAIKAMRERYPALPIVGVEPGLKPAAAASHTRIVGVLATRSTLNSARFAALRAQVEAATQVKFIPQACIGLVEQIEKGELRSPATAAMLRRYVEPLLEQGADTLVLGCTHYPFVLPLLEEVVAALTARAITIVDTGGPVARQLVRLLDERGLRTTQGGSLAGVTTGSASSLADAFRRLLGLDVQVARLETAA